MNTKICKECKKEFVKPYKYSLKQWTNAKFCSLSCKGKYISRIKIKNPKYIEFLRQIASGVKQSEETKIKRGIYKTGKDRWNWKGGITNDGNYLRDNKTKIRIHRQVMEEFLGRKLNKEEFVHHINGDKTDNRIENLELTTNSKHIKKHDPLSYRWGKPTWPINVFTEL